MAKDSVPKEQEIGEGIRKLKTSNVFRVVNFELYAKPVRCNHFDISSLFFTASFSFQNKYMMAFGVCSFTFCIGYMIYMKQTWQKERVYAAITDDDEIVMTKKRKSSWE